MKLAVGQNDPVMKMLQHCTTKMYSHRYPQKAATCKCYMRKFMNEDMEIYDDDNSKKIQMFKFNRNIFAASIINGSASLG
ncbi:conserved hypothetical protein [Ricinus communis]|uniref:Uncharacterized protein n=1 Tax=Ricinus communis TaxID=3988 RepID=B9T148_RICCO|nr:conserved hypothetical protein [Ricinus communis]